MIIDGDEEAERIEGRPREGVLEGSFTVESEQGREFKGFLAGMDPRMQCDPVRFKGEKVTIRYCFDSGRLPVGETIRGAVSLISDLGEKEIEYLIHGEEEPIESSLGEVRSLSHFANLARAAWDEAVNLFFHPGFARVLAAAGERERQLYRGLAPTGKEQGVEEFLLAIGRKTPVAYRPGSRLLTFENLDGDRKEELALHRTGWGYTALFLEVEGEFLSLEKERLSDVDFLGNTCILPFYLRAGRLHQGRNYGRIFLHYAYEDRADREDLEIQIVVCQNQHHRRRAAIERRRKLKQFSLELTRAYLGFQEKKLAIGPWRKKTEECLEGMRSLGDRSLWPRLFQAHLYISENKKPEAKRQLDRVEKAVREREEPVSLAYYLYLTTLIIEDEDWHNQVGEEIQRLYFRKGGGWQVAWLMLHISRQLQGSVQRKWEFLQEVFEAGCTSPVLYTEAVSLLNYQPTLLMELGKIELRILRFGQSGGMLSEEVKGILQYLSLREKNGNEALRRLLQDICAREENTAMLHALLSLLIKADRRGAGDFPWYEKGVLAGIKLTRLYEYYLFSLDREKIKELPRQILLYFSYETDLSDVHAAYLYRYVYERREAMEDIYLAYAPGMERFLLKQLHAGNINEDLAFLYESLLMPELMTPANAKAMEKLMFTAFYRGPKDTGRLVVIHRNLHGEQVSEASRGECRCRLLGKNYYAFREDSRGNRFVAEEEEAPRFFLNLASAVKKAMPFAGETWETALYVCEKEGGWQPVGRESLSCFRSLSNEERLLTGSRQEIRSLLLDFYEETDEMGLMDIWLEESGPDSLAKGERNKLIHYLTARGYEEKAYGFVLDYGQEQIEAGILVRLLTHLLDKNGDGAKKREEFLWLAWEVFHRGKYSASMLEYLVGHYRGSCLKMEEVFRAAMDFEVEAHPLCERLLAQMLFSGTQLKEGDRIFRAYAAGGTKTALEAAFLSWQAEGYLIGERDLAEDYARAMARIEKRGFSLPLIARLAYLKFYAGHPGRREEADKQLLEEYLTEIVLKKQWLFPFALAYRDYPGMEILDGKQALARAGRPGGRLMLHYRLREEGEESPAYQREFMEELYGGLYVRDFLLFAGESLDYYLVCQEENREEMTDSGALTPPEPFLGQPVSRYQRINGLIRAQEEGNLTEAGRLLEEYFRLDYLTERIFR